MYLIGLTGNIASGKSTVRRMLEGLGAQAIDADLAAHAVIEPGQPAWRRVAGEFGTAILRADGSVDRARLGAIVFSDPAKLARLEEIVHPAVSTELALWLREVDRPVAVIEAVKLVEAGLANACDAVWLVTTSPAEARRRLIKDRGLRPEDADLRLQAQPPEHKQHAANVVIDNSGDIEATRLQVVRAFATIPPHRKRNRNDLVALLLGLAPVPATPNPAPSPEPITPPPPPPRRLTRLEEQAGSRSLGKVKAGSSPPPAVALDTRLRELAARVKVRRARPGDVALLADLVRQIEGAAGPIPRPEMLRRFGKWGYWLAEADGQVFAFAAWRAENLVAVLRDLWCKSPEVATFVLPPLFSAIEQEAENLYCEVIIIITGATIDVSARPSILAQGYSLRGLDSLHPVWRAVARDELQHNETLYLKQLRDKLVTAPV